MEWLRWNSKKGSCLSHKLPIFDRKTQIADNSKDSTRSNFTKLGGLIKNKLFRSKIRELTVQGQNIPFWTHPRWDLVFWCSTMDLQWTEVLKAVPKWLRSCQKGVMLLSKVAMWSSVVILWPPKGNPRSSKVVLWLPKVIQRYCKAINWCSKKFLWSMNGQGRTIQGDSSVFRNGSISNRSSYAVSRNGSTLGTKFKFAWGPCPRIYQLYLGNFPENGKLLEGQTFRNSNISNAKGAKIFLKLLKEDRKKLNYSNESIWFHGYFKWFIDVILKWGFVVILTQFYLGESFGGILKIFWFAWDFLTFLKYARGSFYRFWDR